MSNLMFFCNIQSCQLKSLYGLKDHFLFKEKRNKSPDLQAITNGMQFTVT